MVAVEVAEHHFVDGEVHLQRFRIFEHGVGPGAGVEQNALAVGFHHGGEAPFADAGVGEHGGENLNAERLHLAARRLGEGGEREAKQVTAEHTAIVSNWTGGGH